MGTVRTESTEIEGITYTTETFVASEAFDLYAELSTVIPEEVMKLIMLPVSQTIRKKRLGELKDDDPDIDSKIGVALEDLIVTLETPGILAKIMSTVMRQAADHPGGLSSLMKRVLRQTKAKPIRLAPAGGGHKEMKGGEGNVAQMFDSHFDSGLMGMKEAITVCIWVVRQSLGKPSSGER